MLHVYIIFFRKLENPQQTGAMGYVGRTDAELQTALSLVERSVEQEDIMNLLIRIPNAEPINHTLRQGGTRNHWSQCLCLRNIFNPSHLELEQ